MFLWASPILWIRQDRHYFCNKMENEPILYGFELKLVGFEKKNVNMNNI